MLAQFKEKDGLSLGGLLDRFKVNIDSYKDVIKKFNELNLLSPKFKENDEYNWDAIAKAIEGCDEIAVSYFKTLNDGNSTINTQSASVAGLSAHLKATGQSFDFTAIKATLLNTALNAGIFFLASAAIQGVAKALDNYIHKTEKARERTDVLFSEFAQMNATLAEHRKTVAELSDRYDELSKGVNLSNNGNVSLSTDKYEEFLDINEQLAEAFPALARSIDENGNSILSLGTKGITAKEQLEELLKTEEDLNNFKIAQGLEETFSGVYTYVDEAHEATDKLNGSINDSSEAMSKLQGIAENGIKINGENNQLIISGNTNNQAELNYLNALTNSANEFWKSLDPDRRVQFDPSTLFLQNHNQTTGTFELYANTYGLTSEEITALEHIIQDNVGETGGALLDSIDAQKQELQEKIQKGENAWTDSIPVLVSGMKSKQTFKNLDSDLQDIAVQIVEGLDYSYAAAMNEYDPDPYAYIRDKFIIPIGNLDESDKQKLTSSFKRLLKLDTGDLSQDNQTEIEKLINTIAALLKKDPLEIRTALGFDTEDIQNRYNAALRKAKQQLGGYSYSDRGVETTNETGRSIQDFWNENVTTEEDWALWQKVTESITDAALAMDAYTEARKNANAAEPDGSSSIIPTLSSSIQQIAAQLEPQFAKLGEAYQSIFTADGFTPGNIDNSMLDGLRKSFAEIEEGIGITFDASKLESFFDALTSDYADSEEGAKQVQQAFGDLATAYFYSTETLEHLNEETAESIAKQLEEMGVANAQEVVYNALNEKTQELALEKQFLAETGKEVADATQQDIDEFLAEATTSDVCARELTILALKKAAVNGVFLDTSADITNLLSLAQSAGIATENLSLLARAKSGLALAESQGNEAMVSYYTGKIEELGKKAQEDILQFDKHKLDFKGAGGRKSGSGSGSSKSSKDTHKEAYDKELKELERRHKLGTASDEEYWKARMGLNEKFFGESSGMHETYLEEYQKNEEDILEGIKKLWEDYYEERKNNLKDLISYAEKLYDKEIDSLESDIKALEEKRDAEKNQWQDKIDAIGDEINALEEANEERERAIDLQNKQWALQKAMHQRTILLYSETKGMHYAADDKAIRDSQNDLDSTEHDSKVAGLKKQQEDLEKQLDAILETYDSQIEAIEKQIDSLKDIKTAWSDIAENQEFTELEERLISLFGGDVKEQILSGSTAFMDSIVSRYADASDMLRTIEEATLTDIQNMAAQYGVLPENLMPITNAIADITNIMGTVDTSGFNTALDNTAQSSENTAIKVQGVTAALSSLSNEVSNYQLPALNTENFMSAFSEEGGILSALNGFMERYGEICDSIPHIWENSLAEAFGQGGGNGDPLAGGLPNDTKYTSLFSPVLTALDTCRLNMQAKLKECLETFTAFHADLSALIGVGTEKPQAGKTGAGGTTEKSADTPKPDSTGGSGTIVGAIREGGVLIEEALNGEEDSWSASFTDAKDSIHETAISIVGCIESMAEAVVNSCIAAIEAINMLEMAQGGSGSHPAPPPYSPIGHSHEETGSSFYAGTKGLAAPEKNALLSEYSQPEMAVFPDGRHKLYTKPTLADLPKGTVIYNEGQTEKLLREKERISGSAPAAKIQPSKAAPDEPKSFPIEPGDRAWELVRKAKDFLAIWPPDSAQPISSAVFEHQRQMETLTNRIDHISNIQNNMSRPGITIGDINITCPGVTSQEVARQIGVEVNHLFNGLHLDAMQHNIGR